MDMDLEYSEFFKPCKYARSARHFLMNAKRSALLILTAATGILFAQSSPDATHKFESPYVTMTILPGWTVANFNNQRLTLYHGHYVLVINPIFTHASGIEGGRFSEIVSGMPSVDLVMRNVDQPASGSDCAQSDETTVTKEISLNNLYTDSSRTGNGCIFPLNSGPVWFGSLFSGPGSESEYTITLSYDTPDVNSLPKKGGLELNQIFHEVKEMLRTLQLKPPITISRIEPSSAPPGATVTVHGSGFNIPGFRTTVRISELPNQFIPDPVISGDGTAMTFQVPSSMQMMTCPEGRIEIDEACVPTPPNHVDVNDCPRVAGVSTNFCGVPIVPGTYHISAIAESSSVGSESVPFTISRSPPTAVSISLLYPSYLVSPGTLVTVRGSGFTASRNTVKIGSSVVSDVTSPDGTNLTFRAPDYAGISLFQPLHIYEATVSNTNGTSNPTIFWYR